MDIRPTILERAFELAATGDYPTPGAVADQLVAERYDAVRLHLEGNTIRRQLAAKIAEAKKTLASDQSM